MDMIILSVAAFAFAVTCMVFTATTVRNDRCHQDRRSIDAMTTVLNERVIREKTRVEGEAVDGLGRTVARAGERHH